MSGPLNDPRPESAPPAPIHESTPVLAAAGPPRRRWLGSVLAVVIIALVGASAWWLVHRPAAPTGTESAGPGGPGGPGGGPPGAEGGSRRGPPTTVAVAAARDADVPVLIEALGTITSAASVIVRPQVSGVLKQVLFTEGQMVKAGQALAIIDPEPFRIALMQAEGTRASTDAQLQNARLTLQRYQTLLQQDSIARQDVDTQAALVRQLEGGLLTSRAAEASARLNLGYTRVLAPVSGRVGLRPVDAGNSVTSADSNGIVTITQIAPIDVAFAVPQDRVPDIQARLAQGAKLTVTVLDRTRVNTLGQGEFSTLDNLIDTTTGTVKAKARLPNDKGVLFPNQFVNVQLLLRTIEGAVVVPVTAVRNGASGDFVYVLGDDRRVLQRPVKRGPSDGQVMVIRDGLQVGERVVTEGADRLKDGATVQLASERPATAASGASSAASGARQRGQRASDAAAGDRPRRRASEPATP